MAQVMAVAGVIEAILVLIFLYIPKIIPSVYKRMKRMPSVTAGSTPALSLSDGGSI